MPDKPRSKIARFLSGVGIAHLLFLLSLLLLRHTWNETFWVLILFRYAPSVLYVALWLLVTSADVIPNRKRALPSAIVSGALILMFFLNISLPWGRESGEPNLVAVSYNIRAGLAGPAIVADFLERQTADVLCLQEARPPLVRPEEDPAPIIVRELSDYYHARGGVKGELLTLTRSPILKHEEHIISKWTRVLDVTVEQDGAPLRVLNVHCVMGSSGGLSPSGLEHSARARHQQARALVNIVKEREIPTLLLGDFNSPPNSRAHQILSEELEDDFERAGLGLGCTFPARLPLLRIDYIWSRKLRCTGMKVVPGKLSDHLAVRADFSKTP